MPYLMVPSSVSNPSNPIVPTSASMLTSPPLTLTLLPHSFMSKDPCDDTGPNLIIEDNLPISITSAKSLIPDKVTSSQVPEMKM